MSHARRNPKPSSAQNPRNRIPFLWRLCLGVAGAAGIALIFQVNQLIGAINDYYFSRPASSLSAMDVFLALSAVYLLLVAASGRWRLVR